MANSIENPGTFEGERAELRLVLASPLFSRASALSRVLAYICEKFFQGEAESIKEYSIAVEALGRPQSFDPAIDTIVRVEASRLRRRLREYYETEGADHRIHIVLSEIGYVPRFIHKPEAGNGGQPSGLVSESAPVSTATEPAPREAALDTRTRWRSPWAVRFLVGGLFALALIIALLAVRRPVAPVRKPGPSALADVQAASGDEIRILAGFQGPMFIDSLGRAWHRDRYYAGGASITRTFRRIYRTRSQDLYRTARSGDFRYDIPLKPGLYELHLHFVEIVPEENDLDSGGEQTNRFNVALNGNRLLSSFDVVSDAAGPNNADERVFTDVSPAADGYLHLDFASSTNRAHISGIEILPGTPGRMRPVRIVAAIDSVHDAKGNTWKSDHYSLGGKITRRGAQVEGTTDQALYGSERWGYFNYAIPVAPGKYSVTLRFAETFPGRTGRGLRVFDVYCNGTTLLKNFDVFAEAGQPNRAINKVFHDIPANAQGKLMLSFVPVVNYAIVNAIEVVAEN